jgi:uncharacterized protein YydD (DUF2326 family)
MKLIELSANQACFKTIHFNRSGLTLICGSKSNGGSGNGVGKTLALGLVHHCLGANAQSLLKDKLPDWIFSLRFELNGQEHCVQRSADSKILLLNGNKIGLTPYRDWLNKSGAKKRLLNFSFINRSFYSLFKRGLQ